MKFIYKYLVLALMFVFVAGYNVKAQSSVSFQVFFDNLSPYGYWTMHPDYGYVWIPDTEADFVPYLTEGHWVYTNYGWTWVSYYDWGWAPFHYGRWDWNEMYGWFWVPGNEWGPSWVVWRRANGYYGWAPMSPGVGINVSIGIYRDRPERWVFVRDRDVVNTNLERYHVNRSDNVVIIKNSTVINRVYNDNSRNTTYIYGPDQEEVQRSSGRRIRPVKIENQRRPGQNFSENKLEIYRPNVRRTTPGKQSPAPPKVVDVKDIRRRSSGEGAVSPNSIRNEQVPSQSSDQRAIPTNRREVQPISNPNQSQSAPTNTQNAPQNSRRRNEQTTPVERSVPQERRSIPQDQPAQQSAPHPQSTEPSERGSQRTQPETPQIEKEQQPASNRRQSSQPAEEKKPSEGNQSGGRRR